MEMNSDKQEKKQPMTDEERMKLCAKLDKELDEFIEKLPRRKYEDGWPEDRWKEEMEKHPFFMSKLPEPGQEMNPLYEGLQALKYDPEYNEPEELATAYKEDGNFNFKHKNYRLAIVAYTEGIKAKCGNKDLEASLYNNRSAAHYFLENYRSALRDCELALKLKPDYDKVMIRAANCCYNMKQFQKCIEYCDSVLEKQKDNEEILKLRKNCVKNDKLKERDKRKREMELKKREREENALLSEIRRRGCQVEGGNLTLSTLEPCFPQLVHNRVHLNESNHLVWPVVIVYPEYKIMDYIQQFDETHTLYEQLGDMFADFAEWDRDKKYRVDDLRVFFETPKKQIVNVDSKKALGDILKMKEYVIKGGTPSFIVLVRDSAAEKRFLQEY